MIMKQPTSAILKLK